MESNELKHYGTKRHSGRYPWGSGDNPYNHKGKGLLGKFKKEKNEKNDSEKSTGATNKSNSISSLSDEELRKKINRLDLENRYNNLLKTSYPPEKVHAGRKFVMDVLKRSGQNVAEQTATYILGTAVNKIAGKDIINPKKGQKK